MGDVFRQAHRPTGRTQYRDSRGGTDQGTVQITRPTGAIRPNVNSLDAYQSYSGFGPVRAWRDAIAEFHGDSSAGYIYRRVEASVSARTKLCEE